MLTLPGHLMSPRKCDGVCVAQSLVFCVVFSWQLLIFLFFSFWQLYCLSFLRSWLTLLCLQIFLKSKTKLKFMFHWKTWPWLVIFRMFVHFSVYSSQTFCIFDLMANWVGFLHHWKKKINKDLRICCYIVDSRKWSHYESKQSVISCRLHAILMLWINTVVPCYLVSMDTP